MRGVANTSKSGFSSDCLHSLAKMFFLHSLGVILIRDTQARDISS